jgi:hypothetical protein
MSAAAKAWEGILARFAPLFTAASLAIFLRMSSAWVLVPGRRTITAVYQVAEPTHEKAHDAYHRFFREGAWSMSEMWKEEALMLVDEYCPSGRITLYMDDTLFHKSGRRIMGVGWWRDAVRSTGGELVKALGLNILVLAIRVDPPWGGEPLALPVGMRLHKKGGVSLLEIAREILGEVASWFPNREFDLCADGFFAPLAGSLPEGFHLTSRIRKDAALFKLPPVRVQGQRGRPRKKGERLPSLGEMAESGVWWKHVTVNERGKMRERLVFCFEALWYHVCGEKPVLIVISRDPSGKERDDYFFTTDLAASAEEVIGLYAGRWSIEDTFRNTKQFLGGEDPQSWKGQGPERAAGFSFFLYSVVWHWYVSTQGSRITWNPKPWYPNKVTPSFADALASLRRVLWQRELITNSDSPSLLPEIANTLIEILSRAA